MLPDGEHATINGDAMTIRDGGVVITDGDYALAHGEWRSCVADPIPNGSEPPAELATQREPSILPPTYPT